MTSFVNWPAENRAMRNRHSLPAIRPVAVKAESGLVRALLAEFLVEA